VKLYNINRNGPFFETQCTFCNLHSV